MVTDITTLDQDKRYNYAQYLTWRFQEKVELIKGKIFKMSPAPSRRHQKVSFRLGLQFGNYLTGKECDIYSAPFDVRFPKGMGDDKIYTVVQPDICIICDKGKLDDRGCVGAPDMIVEILSPKTGGKDATVKFDLYQENGVKEYWMVYPGEHLVDVYLLDMEGGYKLVKKYTSEEKAKVNIFEDLFIDLSAVFEEETTNNKETRI